MTSTNFLFVIFFVLYATEHIFGSPPKHFGPPCTRKLPSPRPNRKGNGCGCNCPSTPLGTIYEGTDSSGDGGKDPTWDDVYANIGPFAKPLPASIGRIKEEEHNSDPSKRPPSPCPPRRQLTKHPEGDKTTGKHHHPHDPHHHPHHPNHPHHHQHHPSHCPHGHPSGHGHGHGCGCGGSEGTDLQTNDVE